MTGSGRLVLGLVLWAVPAMPVFAQTLGKGETGGVPWLRLVAALLLCLGLAVGAAFALRRRLDGGAGIPAGVLWTGVLERLVPSAGDRPAARLTNIETRRLSPQISVSVFKCDGRDFLVAASVQGQIVLVSLDEDGDPSE